MRCLRKTPTVSSRPRRGISDEPCFAAGASGGMKRMPEESHEARTSDETIPRLTVGQLVEDPSLGVKLRRIAGHGGLERPLNHPRVQQNRLALAGHHQGVVPTRVQLL